MHSTCSVKIYRRKTNSYRSISDLVVVVLLILYSYPRVVTVTLCACIRVFCFSVLLVAMVLLSPHAAPVVSSTEIRVGVTLTRFRFLEDGPRLPGSALSLDAQEVQCRTVSQPGHRKTPEARTTATVAATEVTAAQRICYGRQSPPSTSHSCSLSLSQIL